MLLCFCYLRLVPILKCDKGSKCRVQRRKYQVEIPVVADLGPEEFEGLVDVRGYSTMQYMWISSTRRKITFMGFTVCTSRMKTSLSAAGCRAALWPIAKVYLSALDTSMHLLVYDAARPVDVQQLMWNALDTVPASQRGKYVSNPANLSLHNLGCAVDITICNSEGIAIDMGAGFDDFRDIAFPSKEAQYLKSGALTNEQHENRLLLRKVMSSQKFRQLPTEWWHYNAYSREVARKKFSVLEVEPY